MMFVARKIIEQLMEHQKQVAALPEVAAGRAMPGYGSLLAAVNAQVDLTGADEAEHSSGADQRVKGTP